MSKTVTTFKCRWCPKRSPNVQGRSVHERSKHPESYARFMEITKNDPLLRKEVKDEEMVAILSEPEPPIESTTTVFPEIKELDHELIIHYPDNDDPAEFIRCQIRIIDARLEKSAIEISKLRKLEKDHASFLSIREKLQELLDKPNSRIPDFQELSK